MAKKKFQPQKTSKLNRKINRPIADTQQIESLEKFRRMATVIQDSNDAITFQNASTELEIGMLKNKKSLIPDERGRRAPQKNLRANNISGEGTKKPLPKAIAGQSGNVQPIASKDAITQASQYARSLLEASLDPLVTISPEGKITDMNEATIKVTARIRAEKVIAEQRGLELVRV